MTTLAGLADEGFLAQAVLDVDVLPDWISGPIRDKGIDLGRYRRLVMLGQAGPRLWETIRSAGLVDADPFDDYSRRAVADLVESLGSPAHEIIYPGEVMLPLGRMAGHVGWGGSSPLGLTINDVYGLWMAHRVVFLIDAALESSRDATTHPCDTCPDARCVTACPVGAVSVETGFDVDGCSRFRVERDSPCAGRCLARLACPVGTRFTYGPEQMAHHYASGLESIRQWHVADSGPDA